MNLQPLYPLYESHSDLWPLVAPLESYEEEMGTWADIIAERFPRTRDLRVLDLGTGGGHHLYHLVESWAGVLSGLAVDLSDSMLARAARLVPGFETLRADMTSVGVEQTFSLVTVHDSFCYLTEIAQIERLFATVVRHLEPDGLAVIKIDALADDFDGPYRYLTTYSDDQREVTLTHYEWDPNRADSWHEVIYLFLERSGDRVTTREERHRLGLFPREALRAAWQKAGLEGEILELERWDSERCNPLLVLRPTKVPQVGCQNEANA